MNFHPENVEKMVVSECILRHSGLIFGSGQSLTSRTVARVSITHPGYKLSSRVGGSALNPSLMLIVYLSGTVFNIITNINSIMVASRPFKIL